MKNSKHKAHVQQWKKDAVSQIAKNIEEYSTVALINLRGLPSFQNQQIRAKIRNKAKIIITRKSLLKLAIKKCKKNKVKDLEKHIEGMPGLILTNDSAFELFKTLKQNMSEAKAKAGQLSPKDIKISAGSTQFSPGPIIGQLSEAKIPAGIEDGKVVIKKDCVPVKKGEEISKDVANILSQLDIKPMMVGINLLVAVEKDQLFKKSILDIDIEKYTKKIKKATMDAKKLAIGAGILNKEIAPIKIREAHLNAKKLAMGAEIICDETKEQFLNRAEAQALALKNKISEKEKDNTQGGQ